MKESSIRMRQAPCICNISHSRVSSRMGMVWIAEVVSGLSTMRHGSTSGWSGSKQGVIAPKCESKSTSCDHHAVARSITRTQAPSN